LRRTTLYDVLNAKIGPTGLSIGALMNLKNLTKHYKVLGVYFAYMGGGNPLGGLSPIFGKKISPT